MHSAIQFQSATYTFRAQKALERNHITSAVTRIPKELSKDGCGYMLRLEAGSLPRALAVLKKEAIPVKTVTEQLREAGK